MVIRGTCSSHAAAACGAYRQPMPPSGSGRRRRKPKHTGVRCLQWLACCGALHHTSLSRGPGVHRISRAAGSAAQPADRSRTHLSEAASPAPARRGGGIAGWQRAGGTACRPLRGLRLGLHAAFAQPLRRPRPAALACAAAKRHRARRRCHGRHAVAGVGALGGAARGHGDRTAG
jgi:hypothetical protein